MTLTLFKYMLWRPREIWAWRKVTDVEVTTVLQCWSDYCTTMNSIILITSKLSATEAGHPGWSTEMGVCAWIHWNWKYKKMWE